MMVLSTLIPNFQSDSFYLPIWWRYEQVIFVFVVPFFSNCGQPYARPGKLQRLQPDQTLEHEHEHEHAKDASHGMSFAFPIIVEKTKKKEKKRLEKSFKRTRRFSLKEHQQPGQPRPLTGEPWLQDV